MELNDFRLDVLEQLKVRASAAANFTHAEFVELCAEFLGEAEEISDFEACFYRGTGHRKRSLAVDGFAFDEVDGSLRLVIAEFSGDVTATTITQTQAKTSFARLLWFCEDAIAGRLHLDLEESSPAFALAMMLYEQRKKISRIRCYLITDGVLSARVKDWPEGEVGSIPTEFHIWDMNRFHQVYESKTGRDELEVDFTQVVPGGLPCLPASVEADTYRAYLCVIPGRVLADIYEQYGSRLLEGNVRSFLGARGRINKMIRKTVNQEPTMFFAYNNGIASTASCAEVTAEHGGLRLTKVTDLQIVNGGQTTATLASALAEKDAGLDRTFVQMKLSVVPAETSGKHIPLIARYANSQNRVSDADFFSNHEFHRRIEQHARKLRAPAVGGAQYGTHWWYERARGTYMNEQAGLTPAQRKAFQLENPRKQLVTKTDLAKYENAWRFLPHTVSMGAQKNFLAFSNYASEEWEMNQEQFNEEYYKRVVVKGMIFRRTEELVSTQPWYQGGYRANIVAYTVAKLSHLILFESVGKLFDFKAVWNQQGLSPALEQQLIIIAEKVFGVIVAPEGGFQNVTEWCKKEICWQRVRDLTVPFNTTLGKELIEREEEAVVKKTAAKDQAIMNGIQLQAMVVELGPTYWRAAQDFGRKKQLLSPEEDSIVSVAVNMLKKLPSEKQCARLATIKARLEEEGLAVV